MKFWFFTAIRSILSGFFLIAITSPDPSLTLDGKIIRVIDGDTVVVESRTQYHVRLLDCWCPETRTLDLVEKYKGLLAKSRMVELAKDKNVRVNIPLSTNITKMTTLDRVLGRVWLNVDGIPDSRDLSEIMVSEGFATKTKKVTQ